LRNRRDLGHTTLVDNHRRKSRVDLLGLADRLPAPGEQLLRR
jgi:hypothetical protein